MPRRMEVTIPMQYRGHGLFTGVPVHMTLCKTFPDGIWFQRVDLEGEPKVRATIAALTDRPFHPAFAAMAPRSTNLIAKGAIIGTVEHILSALDGMGITDATLELSEAEVPGADLSAKHFVDYFEFAEPDENGPLEMPVLRKVIEVRDERDPNSWIRASPRATPGRSYRYDLDYSAMTGPLAADAAGLSPQSATWDGTPESYQNDIAPARTFCLKGEADAMRAAGLLKHLTDQDALVIGPTGPINNEYRVPDEPARHKLLDLIGDLALVGIPVQMDVHAHRSGHALNHRLAREIVSALGLN